MIAIPAIEVPFDPRRGADRDDALTVAHELVRNGFSRLHVRYFAEGRGNGKHGFAARHDPAAATRGTRSRHTGRDAQELAARQESVRSLLAERIADLQLEGMSADLGTFRTWFDDGARWVLVDALDTDLDGVADLASHCPDEIILTIVVRARTAAVRVANAVRERHAVDLVEELGSVPLAGVLMRFDGGGEPLRGSDLALIEDIVEAGGPPLLVDRAAATMSELRSLEERGTAGVVLAEALFESTLNPRLIAEEFAT